MVIIFKKMDTALIFVALFVYFVFHLFKQLSFETVPAKFNANIPIG